VFGRADVWGERGREGKWKITPHPPPCMEVNFFLNRAETPHKFGKLKNEFREEFRELWRTLKNPLDPPILLNYSQQVKN